MRSRRVMVTGGAGFIGSALCRHLVGLSGTKVLNVDKLTYAADVDSVGKLQKEPGYRLAAVDICDRPAVAALLAEFQPDVIFHLAAESHVDRSIEGADPFIATNVVGTQRLLDAALDYWRGLAAGRAESFRLIHVSTDEVYGALGPTGFFTEETPYRPSSPYSASKAASDHLALAWFATYGLPVIISNCSNNYGPYQFPEKLIPHVLIRALAGETLPVYGAGQNIRDWLFVADHVAALLAVAGLGRVGEKYNIGGYNERRNIDVVMSICAHLDQRRPLASGHYADRIEYVPDRPGHDFRYAIDAAKAMRELGWQPAVGFDAGLAATIDWYLENEAWWRAILAGGYDAARRGSLTPALCP